MTHANPERDPNSVITDEVRSWIGRTTDLLPLPEDISVSDVRRYLDATGDRNLLWSDDGAAQAAGYRGRVVPPMMVIDLVWRLYYADSGRLWLQIPLPPEYSDTRNAQTEIEWFAPVYVGDRLSIRHRIADITAKPGRRGLGVYITRQTEYFNQEQARVARVQATAVRFPTAKFEAS